MHVTECLLDFVSHVVSEWLDSEPWLMVESEMSCSVEGFNDGREPSGGTPTDSSLVADTDLDWVSEDFGATNLIKGMVWM